MAPVVAHSVESLCCRPGEPAHDELRAQRGWRAVAVCQTVEFAGSERPADVSALADLAPPVRAVERLARRASRGAFPFARRALARHGANVLHSHSADQGWLDLALARASGCAHVISCYGADIWKNSCEESWRKRYLELFREGQCFLVEGDALRAKVESLGCPPQKLVVQRRGVDVGDVSCVERRVDADGVVRVLASGRALEKKGFPFAIQAFARAWQDAPHLRLSLDIQARGAEERAYLDEIRKVVSSEGVESVVEFQASQTEAERHASLYGSHIGFAPSRRASDGDAEGGAPFALLEWAASGMPIVASKHCDIPDVAPDGVSGALFDEDDLDDAVLALLEVATAPHRWREWGRGGRAHVEREHSLVGQVAKLERIYDSIAASR